LVDGRGLIIDLAGGLDHDEGPVRDQIIIFENAVDLSQRSKVTFPVCQDCGRLS
jgi:hypothetical protein